MTEKSKEEEEILVKRPLFPSQKFDSWLQSKNLFFTSKSSLEQKFSSFKGVLNFSSGTDQIIPKNKASTHLLLNGGVLFVPDEMMGAFLDKYTETLFDTTISSTAPSPSLDNLYICEMRTPNFVHMCELDVKHRDYLNMDQILTIVRIIQQGVSDIYSGCTTRTGVKIDTSVIVLLADKKVSKIPKTDEKCIQTGIHLIWPYILTNVKIATLVREVVLHYLNTSSDSSLIIPLNTWSEVYDESIIKDNGLRMIRSRKAEKCSFCHGKTFDGQIKPALDALMKGCFEQAPTIPPLCEKCFGHRKLDTGRPYEYHMVLDADGSPNEKLHSVLSTNPYELVRMCSIRLSPVTSERFPDGLVDPLPTLPLHVKEFIDTVPKTDIPNPPSDNIKAVIARLSNKDVVSEDSIEKTSEVFATIQAIVHAVYGEDIKIISVKKPLSLSEVIYYVKTDAHYCPNKGSAHASSTNYFTITKFGITRRCFSLKNPYS